MIVAVFDTNVLASGIAGYGWPESIRGGLLRRWRANAFRLIVSEPILIELERALQRRYFARRLSADEIKSAFAYLRANALMQPIGMHVVGAATHSADDLILATAVSAGAPFLVTGDKPFLARGSNQGTQFVTPRQFLAVLDREQ